MDMRVMHGDMRPRDRDSPNNGDPAQIRLYPQSCPKPGAAAGLGPGIERRSTAYLLADEQHIDGAEIKVVEERQCCKPVVGRMLARIEL